MKINTTQNYIAWKHEVADQEYKGNYWLFDNLAEGRLD